ncbi:unnamed protein product [Adineta steineri]|uniref:Uncharacterized protein n=1 Tax=Adineta steineri TaxID=433720 RepID=A0A815LYD7_9BILA|nr:unnamed protein product [Adineta steineri]CAF1414930.1 unnamed protein product [Adineta steineri]
MSLITFILASTILTSYKLTAASEVLQGTICGLRTGLGTNCNGQNPLEGCPGGFIRQNWPFGKTGTGFLQFCATSDGNNVQPGKPGTVCGLVTGFLGNLCGGINPFLGCPAGYERYLWFTSWGSGLAAWCSKVDSTIADLPGTVCGMQTNFDQTGVSCGGYSPGRGSCPPGYGVNHWVVDFGNKFWSWCYKQ